MSYKRHTFPFVPFTVFIFLILNINQIAAQRSIGGTPVSLEPNNRAAFSSTLEEVTIKNIDVAKMKKEDRANPTNRFAAPVNVNFNLNSDGTWTDLDNGDRVWRLKIKSEGALGLFIFYKNFNIPVGAKLFVYDDNHQQVKGAYTYQNNTDHGKFMTGMIKGEIAIIEYYEPWYAKSKGNFEINQIMEAYQAENLNPDDEFQQRTGYGDAMACHININCNEASELQDQKRGVVRMLTVYNNGIGWCTGSLINNSANDGTPYILTAHHCGFLGTSIADFSLWRFDFNYEYATCANGTSEPSYSSLLGSELVSTGEASDFLLIKLNSNVPSSFNTYFNGWNRTGALPDSAKLIHHPFGDVKKISGDLDQVESWQHILNWANGVVTPPHSHFRSVFDFGTIEGGSSGAPYFSDGQIIGQLHGGVSNCDNSINYHGKFSYSWNGADSTERLSDWLDPVGLSLSSLPGIENPLVNNNVDISGKITKADGTTAIPLVELQTTGGAILNEDNQADGSYSIQNLLIGNDYTVTPNRNDAHKNGVNTVDLIFIKKHILGIGDPLDTYGIIAGDVNKDGFLNTFDMILIQKIILDFDVQFSNNNAWRFVPADYVFQDPTDPLDEPFPEANFYQPLLINTDNQDFIAIKVGDVNHSAMPNP